MTEFLTIASPRNKPDQNGLGCVPYVFEMAKYQLTNADWCEFLNAVGYEKSLSLKLYHKDMSTGILGGIEIVAPDSTSTKEESANSTVRLRLPTSTKYTPKPGWSDKPVVYIRYEDVCRYCNWLMTGDIEKGAYDLSHTPPKRLRGATYFIPTDDEWYKAAYFDPNTQTYRQYPTGDDLPTHAQANFECGDTFAPIALTPTPSTSSTLLHGQNYFYFSDVDAFSSSPSPFGCVQMGGNAWELLETTSRDGRGALRNHYRGGSFGYTETGLSKQNRDSAPYNGRCYVFGVRIAHLPTGWKPTRKPLKYTTSQFIRRVLLHFSTSTRLKNLPMFLIRTSKFLLRSPRIYLRLVLPWLRAQRIAKAYALQSHPQGERVLIIPCEPWSVNGSRGDEAMMLSTLQQARKRWPNIPVDILVDYHFTNESELEALGFNVIKEWATPILPWFRQALPRYRAVYILGADVTDGVYGWWTSYTLLRFYDLFSRAGIETHYLGFSWSKTPKAWMHLCFPLMKRNLPLPVRDPISFERLQRFTNHRPIVQVADSAFMLAPRQSERVTEVLDWIAAQHQAGKLVIAINVHQMFNGTTAKGADWETALAHILSTVQKSTTVHLHPQVPNPTNSTIHNSSFIVHSSKSANSTVRLGLQTSTKNTTIQQSPRSTCSPRQPSSTPTPIPYTYLLIPHDGRPNVSDYDILKRLHSSLPTSYFVDGNSTVRLGLQTSTKNTTIHNSSFIVHSSPVLHADEIKALVGACDGLIAGRMHISIAALGQGVPVFGLVYQGKFEGLWKLCGLDDSACMPPETFVTNPQTAQSKLEAFLSNLPRLRATIATHLPEVKRLSAINYEV